MVGAMHATTGLVFNIQKFSIHDGPGIRTVVFLKGCPLRCPWCSNPESIDPSVEYCRDPTTGELKAEGRIYSVDEVLEICEQDRAFYEESGGGATLSGGDPLMQPKFATELLDRLQRRGIHTAMETTGHVAPAVFDRTLDLVDFLLIDVKHHDSQEHRRWTGRDSDLPLRNLQQALQRKIPMCVRIPVIPGVNDKISDAQAFARLLRSMGIDEVQLLPFHQFGERKHELLGRDYLMAGVPPLHEEDLGDYRQAIIDGGVSAKF